MAVPAEARQAWRAAQTARLVNRLKTRVAHDLEKGLLQLAIQRLEGFLQYDPCCLEVRHQLAIVYFQRGDRKRAGKYWFFKADKSPEEQEAVDIFSASLGDDPNLILKKLLPKNRFSLRRLDPATKDILIMLADAVFLNEGFVPRYALGLVRHLNKFRK